MHLYRDAQATRQALAQQKTKAARSKIAKDKQRLRAQLREVTTATTAHTRALTQATNRMIHALETTTKDAREANYIAWHLGESLPTKEA